MDTRLNLVEARALLNAGGDPSQFVALVVNVTAAPDRAVGMADKDGNQSVVVPCELVIPRSIFREATVLDRKGRAPNPVATMAPVLLARFVVAKAALSPEALARFVGEEVPELPTLRAGSSAEG